MTTKRERRAGEAAAMRKERNRIRKRQAIGEGWDGRADNDNIAWPLAKALLAEGNGELLKYAMRYRQLYEAAHSAAVLGGKGVAPVGASVDQRIWIRPKDGAIIYKGVRRLSGVVSDFPPRQAAKADDDTAERTAAVPRVWNGDKPVNDMIDAQAVLGRLRAFLGPLVEPLELAVIDCKTLAEIGNAAGIANRAGSMGAGRALVHMALVTIRDKIGPLSRRDLERASV